MHHSPRLQDGGGNKRIISTENASLPSRQATGYALRLL
jgi:hypothetical protein